MYFRYFLLLVLSFALTGCFGGKRTVTKEVVVTKSETKIAVPNAEMLRPCPITPPFDPDVYLNATWDRREDMFTNQTVSLYKDLNNCNIIIDNLKVWFDEQKKIYEKAK